MKTKKVFLLLNGTPPNTVPNISNYDVICATDGAYQYLKENNIKPDFISGDFDSLETIPKNVKVIHTPNQDLTDFDKRSSALLFLPSCRSTKFCQSILAWTITLHVLLAFGLDNRA